MIHRVPLGELGPQHVTAMSTLYLPPVNRAAEDPEMIARLGLSVA
jgi:hypothetical protein